MADNTGIEWTDATWNPTVGCSIVSPGCKGCYAMTMAHRCSQMGGKVAAKYAGLTKVVNGHPVWTGDIRLDPDSLSQPLRWKRGRRIFVNSMSDLFHEDLPDEAIDRVFAVMALAPQHTFQILTKRPERMRAYIESLERRAFENDCASTTNYLLAHGIDDAWWGMTRRIPPDHPWPLPNVWLGVSVEDQQRADERIPYLLATPAAVRFLSCEPLLGQLEIESFLYPDAVGDLLNGPYEVFPSLDWVIVGGESGPGARPMHPDWARSLRFQCWAANVPFFFKQWGEWMPVDEWQPWDNRACIAIHQDGSEVPHDVVPQDVGGHRLHRVGKKAAGRLLDGVEHDGMPEAQHG